MPSSPKIPKETILKHALEMLIRVGYSEINIKALAKDIGCSTQPISWHFGNMDKLRKELREYAFQYANNKRQTDSSGMTSFYESGVAYLNIAFNEPKLFQYLYMSNNDSEFVNGLNDITNTQEGNDLMEEIAIDLSLSKNEVEIFCRNMMIYTHGLASYIASGLITATKLEVNKMIQQSAKGFLLQINSKVNDI